MSKFARFIAIIFLIIPFSAAQDAASLASTNWRAKVDDWVLGTAALGETEFLIFLDEQADISQADNLPTKEQKGAYVYEQLTRVARETQGPLIQSLESRGVKHRPYWVANMIWVRGDRELVESMARRPDVKRIYANPRVRLELPTQSPTNPESGESPAQADGIEWNILKVNAPAVWGAGYTGQGVVIGGQDTGYNWTHEALKDKYRGWDGATADHNYNWHDAIHTGGSPGCPANSPLPCDDGYHGTHTMGTMVGDNGDDHQIGMAPGAKWIGCRNMDNGWGTPATYIECYQWFIAPWPYGGDPIEDADSSKAPHVINNSWSCPEIEGCTQPDVLLEVVEKVRAAGILSAHSAGNAGSTCSSVRTPAAIYDASFTVGNTSSSDSISYSSSRGPVVVDGSNRLKPDISAPGSSINSSVYSDSYTSLNGTSMAAPHVAGLVALLISAQPALAGQVYDLEAIITRTAVPRTTNQICGGIPGSQVPNNTYGWGRIDAWAALNYQALTIKKSASPPPLWAGETLTYTIDLSYLAVISPTHNLVVSDVLPIETTFFTATQPHFQQDNLVRWEFPSLSAMDKLTLTIAVEIPFSFGGPITNWDYGARSDDFPNLVTGEPVTTTIPYKYIFPLIFVSP